MKFRIAIVGAILISVAVIMFCCGSSVWLTDVWTDPGYTGQPKNNVLVVVLAQKTQVRTSFEYQLAHEFTSRGVGSIASVDDIPMDVKLDKQNFDHYFGEKNLDAVLITGLVSADTNKYYIPGASYTTRVEYLDSWTGYYRTVYEVHADPGFWIENTEFVMESTLYDVSSGKLVWRGISKAVNPENVMEIIQDLSKTLVTRLGVDGIVTLQEVK
jgi:hypothetical protein